MRLRGWGQPGHGLGVQGAGGGGPDLPTDKLV